MIFDWTYHKNYVGNFALENLNRNINISVEIFAYEVIVDNTLSKLECIHLNSCWIFHIRWTNEIGK